MLCLSLFMVVVDNTIVNVALPTLSAELGASTTANLQWIVDAYTLVFSALLLAFGYFGDRHRPAARAPAGAGALRRSPPVLAALSQTTEQLIGARALMGVGAALIFPATLAIIINVFTDVRERATAIGIWSGVTGLAVAAGPVTGGPAARALLVGLDLPGQHPDRRAGTARRRTARSPTPATPGPGGSTGWDWCCLGAGDRGHRLGHHRGPAPRLDLARRWC